MDHTQKGKYVFCVLYIMPIVKGQMEHDHSDIGNSGDTERQTLIGLINTC